MVTKIMERSAAAVGRFGTQSTRTTHRLQWRRAQVWRLLWAGFDGLKLDSCSQFNNLTRWAALLNATGREILIENVRPSRNDTSCLMKNADLVTAHAWGPSVIRVVSTRRAWATQVSVAGRKGTASAPPRLPSVPTLSGLFLSGLFE